MKVIMFRFCSGGSGEERCQPISRQHIDNKVKQNLRTAIDFQQVLVVPNKVLYCLHYFTCASELTKLARDIHTFFIYGANPSL